MAIVTYSCTKCRPIDKSILEVYIALKDLDNTASANEDERVAAEEARAEAETARVEEFALLHEQAGGDHSVAEGDHSRAEADHATASADHENAVADRNGYNADHTAAVADHAVAASDHIRAGQDHNRAESDHTRTLGYGEISERDHARAEADHEAIFGDHSIFVDDHNQYLADHATAEEDHAAAVAATAAANAAGITSASASVDSNVGTPSVDVSLVNKQLSLSFHNIKGDKGEKGDRGDGVIPVVNDLVTGGTDAALSAEMGKTLNTSKQATLVSGTNIKTVNGESLLGEGNIVAGDPNAVKYVAQTLTDAQKAQARTNIGAYQKPSGGIPKADLDTGVQGSLDLADTAIQAQPVGSITPPADPSEWATAEEVAQLEAKVTDLEENGGIYDISKANNGAVYNDLSSALGVGGDNIPASIRAGGLSVKFIARINVGTQDAPSYSNEYVQYRLRNGEWSINVSDWMFVGELSTNTAALLMDILDKCVYTEDMSQALSELRAKIVPTAIEVLPTQVTVYNMGEVKGQSKGSGQWPEQPHITVGTRIKETVAFSSSDHNVDEFRFYGYKTGGGYWGSDWVSIESELDITLDADFSWMYISLHNSHGASISGTAECTATIKQYY